MRIVPALLLASLAACGALEPQPLIADAFPLKECATNADCDPVNTSRVCRKSDLKCVSVLTNECPRLLGSPEQLSKDPIVVGLLSPEGTSELGDVLAKATELAQRELDGPFASASARHLPLVFVSCQEIGSAGTATAIAAANHLVKDLDAPVLIGPEDASTAYEVATSVTLPNGVLQIVPTAITSRLDGLRGLLTQVPLLWRLNYSDREMLHTLQAFLDRELVPKLKADGAVGANEDVRIAIVTEDDFKGTSVQGTILERLVWNGQPGTCAENRTRDPSTCIQTIFGNLNDPIANPNPAPSIEAALASVLTNGGTSKPPHIVLHSYSTFGIQHVFFPLEATWKQTTNGKARPYEIGLFPSFNAHAPMASFLAWESSAQTAAGETPLNQRLFSFDAHDSGAQTMDFQLRLQTLFPELLSAHAAGDRLARLYYDAVYLAAYAIEATGDKPVTGANVAATLPRLLQGPVVTSGPKDITSALSRLRDAKTGINLDGLSGSLDLDLTTGAPKYRVGVTCPNERGGLSQSGFYFDETSQTASSKVFEPTTTKCAYLR